MPHDKDSPYIQGIINSRINAWYVYLNEIFGIAGVNLAIGCLGTKSTSFYAVISLIFLFLLYIPGAKKMYRLLKLLREENHESISNFTIFIKGFIYIFGLTILILVACGVLTPDTNLKLFTQ